MSGSLHHHLFATCPPGLEPLLQSELRALGLRRVERQTGGVQFEGSWRDVWRTNLELRTAIRVLLRLERFRAADEDQLYDAAIELPWEEILPPEGTLWIDARVSDSNLTHSRFVAQRTKDAIVDRFRDRFGTRPSVDRDAPDLRLNLHLYRDRVTLSIDTSGDSLHKRGWRRTQGRAPLSEVLAAALVLHSGWNRKAPLLDPFVGSGTILVEAGLMATRTAPGLFRDTFGFERLPAHDARAYAELRGELEARQTAPRKLRLIGSDLDGERLSDARANVEAAGLSELVELEQADARDFAPRAGWNAFVATNPPYGERLGADDDLIALYRDFGDRLRASCEGYTLALITAVPELARALGLRRLDRTRWVHGGLEAEVLSGRLES